MNVKLRVITAGMLFFIGGQTILAQEKKPKLDTGTTEKKIEEVVLLGFSKTITQAKSTVASNTVGEIFMKDRPNINMLQSLQGSAPGVLMNAGSGSPGSAKFSLLIRGTSSINGNTDALIVIDDVPSNSSEFRNLNPNDIESYTVLKDAGATALYGNKGANGVVVIKTKRGRYNSGLKFSYTANTGLSLRPLTKYNLANSQEYFQIMKNYGIDINQPGYELAKEGFQKGTDTDWAKRFFKPELYQSHDLSISTGGKNISTYNSFGYMEQGGAVPTTSFKRFSLRSNLNARSNDNKLNVNAQLGLGFSRRYELNEETNSGVRNNGVQNPLLGVLQGLPYLEANKYNTGKDLQNAISTNFDRGQNIWVLEDILRPNSIPSYVDQLTVLANVGATYKLTDNFTIGNKAGIDFRQSDGVFGRAPWSYLALVTMGSAKYGGFERQSTGKDFSFNNVASVSYSGKTGEHSFDASANMEYNKVQVKSTLFEQNGLDPRTYIPGAGTGYIPFDNSATSPYVPKVSAGRVRAGSLSFFGTFNYDFADKYGLNATIRRDATYRFVGENKWATFWAVSGRWNIEKEDFMQNSGFNVLKLRASYGTNGNQNIATAAPGANPLTPASRIVRDQFVNVTGYGNQSSFNFGYGNPYAQWEEVTQANVGLDFRTFNNRLEGTIDVYDKVTDKLFNSVYTSGVSGSFTISGNNGKLSNRGVELGLRYKLINNENLALSIFANGAYNYTKVIDYVRGSKQEPGSTVIEPGRQLYQWYVYKYAGVNKSNGNLLFQTKDGGVTETPDISDASYVNASTIPKYNGSFGFEANYKGFFLNSLFTFQQGIRKFDNALYWLANPVGLGSNAVGSSNLSSDLLNAWTPTNSNSDIPSLNASNWNYTSDSDYFLKDASFLKIRSVSLGYSLTKQQLSSLPIQGLKLYVQAENIYTWTKWRGFDPEPIVGSSLSIYPNPRMFMLGATIDF